MSATVFVVVIGALVVLGEHAVALAGELADSSRTRFSRVAPILACLLVFVLRAWFVPPSFTHDNFHAGELVDSIFALGRDANPRVVSYGPVGFVVLGALAAALGKTVTVVLVANLVISVLALAVFGAYFARVFERPRVAPLVILAGGLLPPLARVAYSEDLHAMAAFFAGSSLLLLDRGIRERRPWDCVVAVIAAGLMLFTRQTFFVFAPCVVLLVVGTHGLAVCRRAEVVTSIVAILGLALARVFASAGNSADSGTLTAMLASIASADASWAMLRGHLFFDPSRSAFVLVPLAVVGIVRDRARRGARERLVVVVVQFLLTLSFFRSNPGAEFCMRSPFLFVVLGYVGLGADHIVDLMARRGVGVAVAVAVVGATIVFGPIATLRSRDDLRYQSIEYQEYAYVDAVASRLPREFVLIEPARAAWHGRVELPDYVFRNHGLRVRRVRDLGELDASRRDATPILVFEGLNCWSYSLQELFGLTAWDRDHYVESPRTDRFSAAVLAQRLPVGVRVPAAIRPSCAMLLENAEPLPLPAGALSPHTVVPFAYFADEGLVPLRFHVLDAQGLARAHRSTPTQ